MVTQAEMIKGLDSLEALCKSQDNMRRDGLIFLFEKNLWAEFMDYHMKQEIEREVPKNNG